MPSNSVNIQIVDMFDYDAERLRALIVELTSSNINPEAWAWLKEKLGSNEPAVINSSFVLMPRKTGKAVILISSQMEADIDRLKPGLCVRNWTADRLGRLCLIMHLDTSDKEKYFKTIENLFLAGEVSELVALYSCLSVMAWPELWKLRCAEGIRSNMGSVLEAIMYHNPYPAQNLDEKAWNQLVLKAFFTDKDVNQIPGLDERANAELAGTLTDYAHERWAASRKINPQLWRLTSKFMDDDILRDIGKVFLKGSLREKQAAALTAYRSDFEPAKELLKNYPEFLLAIKKNELNWANLAPE